MAARSASKGIRIAREVPKRCFSSTGRNHATESTIANLMIDSNTRIIYQGMYSTDAGKVSMLMSSPKASRAKL